MSILALDKNFNIFGLSIAYYALFILGGAILAYLLARFFTKKNGYDDTILEGTFYVAFPMGIVGARIWYVIAQWNAEFSGSNFWTDLTLFNNTFKIPSMFAIWQGGLAIQGGAILGILTGILYVHYKKPNYNVLAIADLVVPNILIAQAIGRFGNFFNQEVYGKACEPGGWAFLGNWFVDQMTIEGEFRQPLFLIEGLINICGFFIIMFGIRKLLKKYLKPGYLLVAYAIWYGLVRAILEPLRDPKFQMGMFQGIMISQIMAFAFVIGGIILIAFFYVLDKHAQKRKANVPENLENYFNVMNNESNDVND